MTGVDVERFWGDERLAAGRHPVGARAGRGAAIPFPTEPFAPFAAEGVDAWLTVPPAATAWVRTANGWRDLSTLRVLGRIAPHPSWAGAARVRIRRLADADGLPEGVVITPRIEAWLGIGDDWLFLSLNDDEATRTPRVDGRAVSRGIGFAAGVAIAVAVAALALGSVPPRTHALSLDRLAPATTPRLPAVRVRPPDRSAPMVETKHEVETVRPPGGGEPNDDVAPGRATRPRRRAPGHARRAPARGLERMRAAVEAVTALASPSSPPSASASRTDPGLDALRGGRSEDVQRLATLRGGAGTDTETLAAAAWRGPLEHGAGGGFGRTHVPPPRPITTRVTPLHTVEICDFQHWMDADGRWHRACHRPHGIHDSRERVREIVRRHLAELRFCLDHGAGAGSVRNGYITLAWDIDEDGAVTDVDVEHARIDDAAAISCMRAAPRRWSFGEGVGPVRVRYPFVFRSL